MKSLHLFFLVLMQFLCSSLTHASGDTESPKKIAQFNETVKQVPLLPDTMLEVMNQLPANNKAFHFLLRYFIDPKQAQRAVEAVIEYHKRTCSQYAEKDIFERVGYLVRWYLNTARNPRFKQTIIKAFYSLPETLPYFNLALGNFNEFKKKIQEDPELNALRPFFDLSEQELLQGIQQRSELAQDIKKGAQFLEQAYRIASGHMLALAKDIPLPEELTGKRAKDSRADDIILFERNCSIPFNANILLPEVEWQKKYGEKSIMRYTPNPLVIILAGIVVSCILNPGTCLTAGSGLPGLQELFTLSDNPTANVVKAFIWLAIWVVSYKLHSPFIELFAARDGKVPVIKNIASFRDNEIGPVHSKIQRLDKIIKQKELAEERVRQQQQPQQHNNGCVIL